MNEVFHVLTPRDSTALGQRCQASRSRAGLAGSVFDQGYGQRPDVPFGEVPATPVPRAPLACFRFGIAAPVVAVSRAETQRETKRMSERKSATAAEGPARRYQSGERVKVSQPLSKSSPLTGRGFAFGPL